MYLIIKTGNINTLILYYYYMLLMFYYLLLIFFSRTIEMYKY